MTGALSSASAATSVADLVLGPERPAEVLGAFPTAVYLRPEGSWRVLAVEARDGVGLPNGVRVGAPSAALRLASARRATVGQGRLITGGHRVVVDRWRDPRLHLGADEARRVMARADHLAVAAADDAGLADTAVAVADALVAGETGAARDIASRLLGSGAGLTPSGDDVLAGMLATLRTLAAPLGLSAVDEAAHDVGGALVTAAVASTTALSAALLWHAARGELADPARHALRGLAGRTPLAPARDELVAVGHRSGRDLALGMAVAARALAAHAASLAPARSA